LIRRIAWRLQANAEGGLSERALKGAAELALDFDVRITSPREPKISSVVVAAMQSKPIRVLVLKDGFEYERQLFNSLTAVFGYASMLSGPPILGLFAHSWGILAGLWLPALSLFLSLIFIPAVGNRRKRQGTAEPEETPAS
jgi:hypothetical protein